MQIARPNTSFENNTIVHDNWNTQGSIDSILGSVHEINLPTAEKDRQ